MGNLARLKIYCYGPDYWGAPWSGILMMTLVCVVLGTWLAYVTLRSASILPAAIFHPVWPHVCAPQQPVGGLAGAPAR